ncbi:alpha/beta fold hydrolase [Pseudomonas sp. 5P_5.1_Bac1]|uniref:alpha/beta fold hydrolase n=1 Tax=Pseudomonas sp. 5P_5.1_Bac1 TaxID=2971616 RepID=UPI0021CA8FC9|nr:alpha/beta hydrolase [Pseudomonas sp. 5P_5.1_Bac1]MCU1721797.1 alpha/beta hydrolase [Pseudomonas sp. 5P_5.1_Bac1]
MPEQSIVTLKVAHGHDRLFVDHRSGSGSAHLLAIHGGGAAQAGIFDGVRAELAQHGVGSTAFDCIGHGRTGGDKFGTSLQDRTAQARAVIEATRRPTAIIGSSMGAYNAIRLSETLDLSALVLVVPGVYCPEAYDVPFGPAFSRLIRQPRSWADSDAWMTLSRFRGRLLVITAGQDEVVPPEIPQRLHDAAVNAEWRSLLVVPDAPHSGLLARMLDDPRWRGVFLRRLIDCMGV